MGIKDLLRFMKPFIEPIHIKKYAGMRVGIDAYSWLHKGAYSCSMELCLDSEGDKKLQYLNYFMHRINLLRHYKITPVVVLDGGNMPCKAFTDQERHRRRKGNHDLAMEKLKQGNLTVASELFQKAISVTPSMAHHLIQILKSENIEFVVAPYEADAQLAYLSTLETEQGGIAAVVTEDSDLLAYGCPATVFKMDRYGNGEEIVLDKVFNLEANKPSFRNFDKEMFIGMCVLAGCDFLPSVPGIGIARAHSLVSKYRNLDRVLSTLKIDKGSQMPEDYIKCFKEAVTIFRHARIYDSLTKRLQHLKPLPHMIQQSFEGNLDFLGPDIPSSMAIAIAEGNLDPTTMEAFDHFSNSGLHANSITIRPLIKPAEKKTAVVPTQESCFTVFTNGTGEKKSTVASTEKKKGKAARVERRNLAEAVAMTKLVPSGAYFKVENTVVSIEVPLNVPDNNPFKKRKEEQARIEEAENAATEQVSGVTEVENICNLSPANNPFKKRKQDQVRLDRVGCDSTGQISEVTEVENTHILCGFVASQESVESKPKIDVEKLRGTDAKKQNSGSSSERNKKCSILNFFSRV